MKKPYRNPSHRLTFQEAIDVWRRAMAGEFQNRIAAHYDVNPGRINEVLKEQKHRGSREAALGLK